MRYFHFSCYYYHFDIIWVLGEGEEEIKEELEISREKITREII